MGNRLLRFQTTPTLLVGVATLLWLPGPARAQSTTTQDRQQDRQVAQNNDDITRRDLARFDQFLDSHREDAQQLRRTPALVDDPQFLQSHPALNEYLQEHPSVKQEISQQPDTFMRLEDRYDRDHDARDRDAGGRDRDAYRQDRDAGGRDRDADRQDRDAGGQDRDAGRQDRDADRQDRDADRQDRDAGGHDRDADRQDRDAERREAANFDRFLDDHREIGEQVRKNPSLVDNREFVQSHPALQTYLQDHPEVREQLRQDPNAFVRQADRDEHASNLPERDYRDSSLRDRDADGRNRDADRERRELADFDRFLDRHREIAEQVRKDPSLLDRQEFVQSHPALNDFLKDNPGVRDQLKQDPNAFMRQEDQEYRRPGNGGDRDSMHDHMADFGGFLGGHPDIQKDLARNPAAIKDHDYVQNHAELNTYLNAHPDVRNDLMANPQSFVKGAQQYSNNGTGNPATTTTPKPKQ